MRDKTLTLILTIPLILFCSTDLSADDYRKADSFFERNDGKNVSQKNFYESQKRIDPSSNIKPNIKNPSDLVDRIRQKMHNNNGQLPKIKPVIPSVKNSNVSGEKVLNLGVVINSMERSHLERHLNTLIKTSTKLDLDIGEVDFIGMNSDITDKFAVPIVSRFGRAQYLSSPPTGYNITISPTWILQTEKGQILLEGIDDPQSYMNSNAEFIEGGSVNSPYQNDERQRSTGFFEEKNSGMDFF